ncbi:MAG: hypothetical protein H6707_16085 [Deltaproteobacteria bacterium]|nr:hypothetical protein [Deltaproteobacteria bacterium]
MQRTVSLGSVLLTFSLAAAITLNGCESKKQTSFGDEPTTGSLPQVAVNLPAPPSFKKDHAPETYPDSSYSVYGVRKNEKKTIAQQVRVKGFIIDVYQCPPCPRGSKCAPCKKPHFWLADRANTPKDDALLVTDYPPEDARRRKTTFDVGTLYIVSGTFAKSSATGFSSSEGLLVYSAAEPVIEGK